MASEASGERAAAIALEHIVAVYLTDDARHLHSLDLAYFDNDVGQGSNLSLQFSDSEDVDLWKKSLRSAADHARLLDRDPIPPKITEYVARIVEAEKDYNIQTFRIYKVVKLSSTRVNNRSSSDDFSKVAPSICFLAIGCYSVHIIPIPKNHHRLSSPGLADLGDLGSFGIMSLTAIVVNSVDDSFSLSFR